MPVTIVDIEFKNRSKFVVSPPPKYMLLLKYNYRFFYYYKLDWIVLGQFVYILVTKNVLDYLDCYRPINTHTFAALICILWIVETILHRLSYCAFDLFACLRVPIENYTEFNFSNLIVVAVAYVELLYFKWCLYMHTWHGYYLEIWNLLLFFCRLLFSNVPFRPCLRHSFNITRY